jgi:hypothetical protein
MISPPPLRLIAAAAARFRNDLHTIGSRRNAGFST